MKVSFVFLLVVASVLFLGAQEGEASSKTTLAINTNSPCYNCVQCLAQCHQSCTDKWLKGNRKECSKKCSTNCSSRC
ncbi:hypothetical protein Ciccas_012265 [Cichlidogyrus casuarinus]|uniref:Uncharacterized protein n=1 Tax=Cichlidogyrus casuarinus TaxID=1844966 RepID=A0ABD2PPL0_9PLAT